MTYDQLRQRYLNYKSAHPVTFAGVCKMCGIKNPKKVADFVTQYRLLLSPTEFKALDNYLVQRGF